MTPHFHPPTSHGAVMWRALLIGRGVGGPARLHLLLAVAAVALSGAQSASGCPGSTVCSGHQRRSRPTFTVENAPPACTLASGETPLPPPLPPLPGSSRTWLANATILQPWGTYQWELLVPDSPAGARDDRMRKLYDR